MKRGNKCEEIGLGERDWWPIASDDDLMMLRPYMKQVNWTDVPAACDNEANWARTSSAFRDLTGFLSMTTGPIQPRITVENPLSNLLLDNLAVIRSKNQNP